MSVSYNQMKKGLFQFFACALIWIVTGSVHALEPAAAKAPVVDGLPGWVEFDGKQWHTTQLLARLNPGVQRKTAEKLLRDNGMEINRDYRIVPGLVCIDLSLAKREEAKRWTPVELEANLKNRRRLLADSKLFRYVEFDGIVHGAAVPTDQAYQDGRLWGLHNIGQSGGVSDADIDASDAWDITTGRDTVIVAVCDSGIRYTHEDLKDQMWVNEDEIPGNGQDDDGDGYVDNIYGADPIYGDGDPMDGHGHGTHVAGTIGASANDEGPHVGVAWNVKLMALKCLNDFNYGSMAAIAGSVDFATLNGATICNLSLGGPGFSQAMFDVVVAAADANVILACAAGNSGADNDGFPNYPSNYEVENVIAVAATDRNDLLADFSCYGVQSVDLGAPGVEIFSCTSESDNSYDSWPGTSMATPHVAGVLALMRSLQPDWSYLQIREKLFAAVDPLPSLDGKVSTGGRLNAFKAIDGMGDAGGGLIPDGVLEVAIMPASGSMLLADSSTNLFVTVVDGPPVTNAVVSALVEINNEVQTYFFNNSGDDPDVTAEDNIYSNTIQLPKKGGKMKISLMVEAPDKQPYLRVVNYDVVPIPENDNFANAYKITGFDDVAEGFNTFATLEASEPNHAVSLGQAGSLWWNWSPPADGMLYADAAGSDGEMVLAVYVGTDLESAVRIADSAPVDGERPNFVQWEGKRGRTYHIAVASLTESQKGYVRLRTEVGGSPDVNPPIVRFTSPHNGIVSVTNRVELTGMAIDPQPNASGVKEVFVVQNNQAGVSVLGTQKWNLSVFLSKGINNFEVYGVDYAGNVSNAARLVIDHRPPEVPNDHFVDAQILNRDVLIGDGSRIQYPASQPIDDLANVIISIDGKKVVQGEVEVSELNSRYIVFAEPPAKNSVIEVVHPNWTAPAQSTARATREEGEPLHAGNEGIGSIWYKFIAPTDGLLTVSSKKADFDTVMGLYIGERVDDLTLLAFNDEDPSMIDVEDNPGVSRIDQALEGGMEVYIAVDGFAAARGTVSLTSVFAPGQVHRLSVTANEGGKLVSALPQPFSDGGLQYTLFQDNGVATLEVRPDGGNVFEGWEGSVNSLDNPLDLVVTENISVVANFAPVSLTENFETGDFGHLQWKTTGDAKWFVQSAETSGSKFSAQAGKIGDGQSSSLILDAEFTGGEGSFEVKVSSEKTWDKLEFLIDGRRVLDWSGINDWGNYTFQITPGKHRLEWRYQKDFANGAGEDTAWLDNIDLPLQLGASLALEQSGDTARLRLWGSAGHRYDIEVSSDFVNWEKWDSVFIDAEGVKLLEKVIELNGSEARFFRAVAP